MLAVTTLPVSKCSAWTYANETKCAVCRWATDMTCPVCSVDDMHLQVQQELGWSAGC